MRVWWVSVHWYVFLINIYATRIHSSQKNLVVLSYKISLPTVNIPSQLK